MRALLFTPTRINIHLAYSLLSWRWRCVSKMKTKFNVTSVQRFFLASVAWAAVVAGQTANATPTQIGASRVLGIVVPGTPADVANAIVQVNGLLDGWNSVLGYKDGAASGSVLGNNPNDPQNESYKLTFATGTMIPTPANAPLAVSGTKTDTSDPLINLGNYRYDWVLAKWGQDSEIYYIGGLTGEIQLNLVNFAAKAHGLSHYVLFNQTVIPAPLPAPNSIRVPDGGTTVLLLGLGILALGCGTRRM